MEKAGRVATRFLTALVAVAACQCSPKSDGDSDSKGSGQATTQDSAPGTGGTVTGDNETSGEGTSEQSDTSGQSDTSDGETTDGIDCSDPVLQPDFEGDALENLCELCRDVTTPEECEAVDPISDDGIYRARCNWETWVPTKIVDGECVFGEPQSECYMTLFEQEGEEGAAWSQCIGASGFPTWDVYRDGIDGIVSLSLIRTRYLHGEWNETDAQNNPTGPCFDFESDNPRVPECACICDPDYPRWPPWIGEP